MSSTATTTTTTTTSSINAVPDTITTTATPPDSASTVPAAASTPKKKSKHHQHHQHQRRVREDGDLNGDDVPAMMHSRSSGDIAALATGRVNVRRRRRTRKDSATTALLDTEDRWRLSVDDFKPRTDTAGLSKHVAAFYWQQNELIQSYRQLDQLHDTDARTDENASSGPTSDHWTIRALVNASFATNVVLMAGKLFATIVSGSLAVLASLLDSCLDLLSGFILFFVQRSMRRTNQYMFPAGKSRLEPLGIIVFASVMFTATSVVIIESITSLVNQSKVEEITPIIGGILAFVVGAKLILFILCWLVLRAHNSPTLEALMQDHRNDLITNTFGVGMVVLAYYYVWWLDAASAILMSAYIMVTWARTGWHHVEMLSGKSASPSFLSQLTFVCWNHSPKVLAIDTVRAFHLSFGFLVEVDIVLPEEMSLREAHDIGEALQWKLEAIPEVERAFVHLDYETQHKPEHVGAHRPEWSHTGQAGDENDNVADVPRRRRKTSLASAATSSHDSVDKVSP